MSVPKMYLTKHGQLSHASNQFSFHDMTLSIIVQQIFIYFVCSIIANENENDVG